MQKFNENVILSTPITVRPLVKRNEQRITLVLNNTGRRTVCHGTTRKVKRYIRSMEYWVIKKHERWNTLLDKQE